MNAFRRLVLWAILILVAMLAALSVFGAFLGADRAKAFFNSIPLAVYWGVFLITLAVGCILFKSLIRVPALLLIHAGCMAILIGGLWGSNGGQQFQRTWLGRDIIPSGQMRIGTGQTENRVHVGYGNDIRELPFALALEQFRIDYYEPAQLHISSASGKPSWTLSAEPNALLDLGSPYGSVQVVRTYRNFRIAIEEGGSKAYEDPGPGSNAAVEVLVTPPGGQSARRFVFEQHPGHATPGAPLTMQYRRTVKDYVSVAQVIKGGSTVAKKAIEVNHPLYYGGYHFYQSSYGQDPHTGQMYTVLSVASDSGLYWVYAGYLLLCIGVAWKCWFKLAQSGPRQEGL